MLAVTTRPAVRLRLQAVSTAFGLPAPLFAERLEAVLESGADTPVLFLDLGSCCKDRELGCVVQTWMVFRPGSEVIAFTPLIDRETELRAVVDLLQNSQLAGIRVMTASDFCRDETWRNLLSVQERAALESELRSELLQAVARTGRPLRAEPLVLRLLHEAPQRLDIRAVAAVALARMPANAATERKALWRLLRRSGQLPASQLLLVFRVLWYAKLASRGWSVNQIASFLGFSSARIFRLSLRRRLGVGVQQLARIRYEHDLIWAAALLTSCHCGLGDRPMRALIAPLLKTADANSGFRAARRFRLLHKQ